MCNFKIGEKKDLYQNRLLCLHKKCPEATLTVWVLKRNLNSYWNFLLFFVLAAGVGLFEQFQITKITINNSLEKQQKFTSLLI